MPTKDTHIIDIRTKGANRSKQKIGGVNNALGSLAKKAGVAALAYFGTQGLINAVKGSIDAFQKQELAEKKLRFAAGAATSELIKQAQALQKTTKFGDEAIIAQQAYVKSLGISTEQTKEIISASVELAAAMGMSLESAVRNTTKTLSGLAGELGETLPGAFRELSTDALKAGEGIQFIADQFGGTAAAEVQTMSGALSQTSNAIGDLGEALGETLAPLIIASANAVKFMAEQFQSLFTWQDKYRALAVETLGLLSDEQKLLMQNKITAEEVSSTLEILNAIRETYNDSQKLFIDGVEQTSDAQTKMFGSTKELTNEMIANSIAGNDMNELIFGLIESGNEFGPVLQDLVDKYKALPDSQKLAVEEQKLFNQQLIDSANAAETQKLFTEEFIQLYPEYAKKLGMVSKEEKRRAVIQKQLASQYKSIQLAQIIGDTYSAARAQFKEYSKAYDAPLGFILGTAAYATTVAQGYADYDKVRSAQYGADFVTDGPQMMLVGEGSGPERVQVTPLVDENIDGPQGQGVTLNISGNVMTEDFVEETLVPNLKEELRLGGDIGIN